jgi:fumarylpyruvate hydrolase
MSLVIPAVPAVTVPVANRKERFPVHRIYCVGRNYAAHAREMGSDPTREPPFFFTKPADAVLEPGTPMTYPPATRDCQHEVELVVALKAGGRNIPVEKALDLVFGYAVGLDMTRRDLQADARKGGRPWDMAKGFDQSAPIAPIQPVEGHGHVGKGAIWVKVNGLEKQKSRLEEMIWNVPETLAHLSGLVTLQAGDLIFTGTPEGVGPVVTGDVMVAHVEGLPELTVTVGPSW